MLFALYMAPVIFVPLIAWLFWREHYSVKGYSIQLLVGLGTALFSLIFTIGFPSYSTEILNTEIVSKSKERVSCSHSYDCNPYQYCSRDSKGKEVCETRYRTCYEHDYDVSWRVQTGLEEFTISRVNRRGDKEPARWSQVQIGEPAAHTHAYRDYIKSNPASLFNLSNAELMKSTYAAYLPNYPESIYDYHRIDRVLGAGINVPDNVAWNKDVSELLKKLGPQTQTNVVIVFTNQDPMYAEALRTHWLLGRKNDIIVVAGVKKWPELEWVKVFSWSKNDMLNVSIREDLMNDGIIDRAKFMAVIRTNTLKHFVRKPMADYSYIKPPPPSVWTVIVLFIISIGVTIGTNIYIRKYHKDFL